MPEGIDLPDAQPTVDVWGVGVVLYVLCTGKWLFNLDGTGDRLSSADEEAKLRAWRG